MPLLLLSQGTDPRLLAGDVEGREEQCCGEGIETLM